MKKLHLALLAIGYVARTWAQAPAEVSYFREIRPIIQQSCQGCHQPAAKYGGLDLTSYQSFAAGGGRGPAFQAGAPGESLVIAYLKGERQPRMPFGAEPLPGDQIELFSRWISSGAKNDMPASERSPASAKPAPPVTALAYSPDGTVLAVSGDREVLLYKTDGSGFAARLPGLSERVQSLVFSRDGKMLVAAGGTPGEFGEVQFWDVAGRKLQHSVTLSREAVSGASFSPDGARLAVGCADNTVRLVDAALGKEVLKFSHHENWVLGTAFSVDGKRVVSVGRDGLAQVNDATTGAFLENINTPRGELAAIARHPTRDLIVIGGAERVPYLYNLNRDALVRTFQAQDGPIFALAFSPDGGMIAVGDAGDDVPVYQAGTGQPVATCKGSRGTYAVTFSPDGQRLAAGGGDGRVRICDAKSGGLVREFAPIPQSPALSPSEPFPHIRRESSAGAEPHAFVQLDCVAVGGGHGQADPVGAVLAQRQERSAQQLIADARSAHFGRRADLRDVPRFRPDHASQRQTP